jgi:hypothetical protein
MTAAIFTAAIALIVTGVFLGEPAEVAQKAINICLECIGIG